MRLPDSKVNSYINEFIFLSKAADKSFLSLKVSWVFSAAVDFVIAAAVCAAAAAAVSLVECLWTTHEV